MRKLNAWMEQRSRTSFILMLVVGGYLFYATYKMFQRLPAMSGSPVPIYIFMGLFVLAGAGLLAAGLYALLGGHYSEKLADTAGAGEHVENNSEKDSE